MMNILIIDDTRSVHAYIKSLGANNSEVSFTSVRNGEEAVNLLREKNDFDVILLDWEMPVLDGPSAFKKFKEMNISTPTLMMTTKNAMEDIKYMLDMGVAEYLMKPFTRDIFFEKIELVTGRSCGSGNQ